MTRPPTERQRDVLRFIKRYVGRHGYPPTIHEIGEHIGVKSTNGVTDHLKALQRKGYLSWQRGLPRTLRVIEPGEAAE